MGFYRGPSIVKDGLVLYLDAANPKSYPGSGTTWSDLSGNSNTGTLINGPTFDSGSNGCIVFDGVNDYVTGSMVNFGSNNSFTTITWFNAPQTSNEQHLTNISSTQLYIRSNKIGTSNYGSLLGGTILPNKWYMVVCTKDTSNNGVIYVNGDYTVAGTLPAISSISKYVIGNFVGGGSYFFGGNIAISQIYNRALTAAEVKQNYNATKSRFNL